MMQGRKPKERGYTVVWLTYGLIIALDLLGGIYLHWITKLNQEVLMMNIELIRNGFYTVVYPSFDTTIIITMLGFITAAYPIVASAQLKKKAKNNNFEYLELYMNEWMRDPEMRPYAAQIFSSFLNVDNL